MKMKKEESSLNQMLDKYHTHISPIEEKKTTQLDAGPSAKIISNLNLQSQTKTQIQNSNEPRHKNLEKMLKKLNTEQEIDYLNKTTCNPDSFYSANQHPYGQISNNNNNIINRSHQQESNHKGVLDYLKKSKKEPNFTEESQLFQQETDAIKMKPSFTTVFNTKLTQTTLNSPLSSIIPSSNIKNANQESLYLKTSVETCHIVQSIDSRIRELKLKFLRDIHVDIIKLSKYQNTVLTLLSFLTEKDIEELYHSCSKSNQMIRSMINTHCRQFIIDPFMEAYGKCFIFQRCLIKISSTKARGFTISSIIQCKTALPKDYSHSTIEFSNMASLLQDNRNTKYRNSYRFDYCYEQKPSTYWFMKEETFFNYDDLSKAYCMPLIPISFNDSFTISVNMISRVGIINFFDFKWGPVTYNSSNKGQFEDFASFDSNTRKKSKSSQLSDYDLSRFCELELIKTKWMDYFQANNLPDRVHHSINKHIDYLNELFSIDRIEYDDVGFLIVKFHTVASCKGTLPTNKDTLGIELSIRKKAMPIVNEIKKNGLIYDMGNRIEFRQGDKVFFYFSFDKHSEEETKQKTN